MKGIACDARTLTQEATYEFPKSPKIMFKVLRNSTIVYDEYEAAPGS
jgi:hypothetical protein